jgi:hypothetical protein
MSVFSKVEDFFKKFGHHVQSAFVTLFGSPAGEALASAAEEWAKTQLGQLAVTVVQGLETAALAPADKEKQAFSAIAAQLAQQGKSLPTSGIKFAIEFALQIVRGATSKAAAAGA